MRVLGIVEWLADACYGLLAVNFLWGLFCVILATRRIRQLRFRSEQDEIDFVDHLDGLLKARNYDEAASACDYDFRALPRMALLALANRGKEYAEMRQVVSTSLQRHILADLENRLSWIVTVIKNGPLLGLFGTVLGMMAAFGRIGTGEKVQPAQIADEISVALICTAMGLGTAIPLGYVLAGLNQRTRLLQQSLEANLGRVLNHFRPQRG
jgi:biopolymer transport protein ExbB/TolQ